MVRRVTLREVAQEAQVSVATASLVLNNKPSRISQPTQQRIRDVARRLHYVVNENARGLVTNETRLIALIVPDIENMFFASLSKCLETECRRNGYQLFISNSDDDRTLERRLMRRFVGRDIDGLLLIPSIDSYTDRALLRDQICASPCPIVIIDRLITADICDGVGFDNELGGRLAAKKLLCAGHRRFACITGNKDSVNANTRCYGFLKTLQEHEVPADSILTLDGNYRFSGGYDAADAVADFGATCLFCCNDLMALGAIDRFRELGIAIPADISIIGYDTIVKRFGLLTRLTTVEQNVSELASQSWQCLYRHIQHHDSGRNCAEANDLLLLEPQLVEGDTVAQAPIFR